MTGAISVVQKKLAPHAIASCEKMGEDEMNKLLRTAVKRGQIKAVKRHLSLGFTHEEWRSALCEASMEGHLDVVEALLSVEEADEMDHYQMVEIWLRSYWAKSTIYDFVEKAIEDRRISTVRTFLKYHRENIVDDILKKSCPTQEWGIFDDLGNGNHLLWGFGRKTWVTITSKNAGRMVEAIINGENPWLVPREELELNKFNAREYLALNSEWRQAEKFLKGVEFPFRACECFFCGCKKVTPVEEMVTVMVNSEDRSRFCALECAAEMVVVDPERVSIM